MPTALAEAIAKFEGWYKTGSVAQRNNNPGNLTNYYTGQFEVFSTPQEGWAALEAHITRHQGLSLQDYIAGGGGYAGYDPGNTGYASTLAKWLGVGTDQSVASIVSGAVAPSLLAMGPTGSTYQLPGYDMQPSSDDLVVWAVGLSIAGLALVLALS